MLWHQCGGLHVAISRRASHFHFKYATCLVSSHISGIYPPLLVAILFLILKTPSPLAIHFYLLLWFFSLCYGPVCKLKAFPTYFFSYLF